MSISEKLRKQFTKVLSPLWSLGDVTPIAVIKSNDQNFYAVKMINIPLTSYSKIKEYIDEIYGTARNELQDTKESQELYDLVTHNMVLYFRYLIVSDSGQPVSFISVKKLNVNDADSNKTSTLFNYFGHSTHPDFQGFGLGDYLRKIAYYEYVKENSPFSKSRFFYLSTNVFLFLNSKKFAQKIPFSSMPLDTVGALRKYYRIMQKEFFMILKETSDSEYEKLLHSKILLFAKTTRNNKCEIVASDVLDNIYVNFGYLTDPRLWNGNYSHIDKSIQPVFIRLFFLFKACFLKNVKTLKVQRAIARDFISNEHPPQSDEDIETFVAHNLIPDLGLIKNAYIPADDTVQSGEFYPDLYFNYIRCAGDLQIGLVETNSASVRLLLEASVKKNSLLKSIFFNKRITILPLSIKNIELITTDFQLKFRS